jgi:hypothetical protein
MKAKLKALHSPDVVDLVTWQPEDHSDFDFLVQALFGPENEQGAETFDIRVCSPERFAREFGEGEVRTGQHILFMSGYHYERLRNFLERYCHHCEADTWPEVAMKLSHLGHWEFDGYTAEASRKGV